MSYGKVILKTVVVIGITAILDTGICGITSAEIKAASKSWTLIMVLLTSFLSLAFGETVKMKDTPIKSRISFKQLNRIDIVSGLDAAFHFEKNEKTGDGYIKPTQENGHEPVAVSVTTASGREQELILDVDNGNPNVLILENDEVSDNEGLDEVDLPGDSDASSGTATISNDYEASVVLGMKRLIAEENILPSKLAVKPSKNVKGFNVKFLESYKVAGGFI